MSVIKSRCNKSISHKLKRQIAFEGWRRHISGKEKVFAKESKKPDFIQELQAEL